jgi:Arc/MetJ-type ribon-helix-helix transcriptional regulator
MAMQIVTANIPSIYIDAIAKLVDEKLFPSRSEAIRVALRDFLKSELVLVDVLLDLNENDKDRGVIVANPPGQKEKKIDMRSIQAGWGKKVHVT